jgi:hypothetical protein
MARHPAALQLRFLQTVVEIAAENNSTTLFPLPLDLFRPFLAKVAGVSGGAPPTDDDAPELDALEGADDLLDALESGERAPELLDASGRAQLAEAARKALGLGPGDDDRDDDRDDDS